MKHIIWVLWPAFIAAGIAETLFFTVIDPQQLYLMGRTVELSPMATYSLGFLMFWLMCTGSSLITWFMLPQDIKRTLDQRSREHLDLSHRQRGAPAGGPPAHDRPDNR